MGAVHIGGSSTVSRKTHGCAAPLCVETARVQWSRGQAAAISPPLAATNAARNSS
jgi:hypothetical protein